MISTILTRNKKEGILSIIIWWEIRRVLYNLIMLIVGIPATILLLIIMEIFNPSALESPDDFVPFIAIIVSGTLANIFYTFGWITEIFKKLILKDKWPNFGPILWLCGMCFSIIICFLPSVLNLLYGVFTYYLPGE